MDLKGKSLTREGDAVNWVAGQKRHQTAKEVAGKQWWWLETGFEPVKMRARESRGLETGMRTQTVKKTCINRQYVH